MLGGGGRPRDRRVVGQSTHIPDSFCRQVETKGQSCSKSSRTPEKPKATLWGENEGIWARGKDRTLTFLKPTARSNVVTLRSTQGQTCAVYWRKTHCAGGTLDGLAFTNFHEHVYIRDASNIPSGRETYISNVGDTSRAAVIHPHNTPLQLTRITTTPSASSIATHSLQS
jgi:hypothetical protein